MINVDEKIHRIEVSGKYQLSYKGQRGDVLQRKISKMFYNTRLSNIDEKIYWTVASGQYQNY
jgi:hypothetical protein